MTLERVAPGSLVSRDEPAESEDLPSLHPHRASYACLFALLNSPSQNGVIMSNDKPAAFGIVFEYDQEKSTSNWKKHGVSFQEATSVFVDPLASTLPDNLHSDDEQRFITIGLSSMSRVLFVVYTERGFRVRIIGARLAETRERKQYEEHG
jgi:uncharacterized DUF497 family protein